jgi:hypothetical protein
MARFVLGCSTLTFWTLLVSFSGITLLCEKLVSDYERWEDEEEGGWKVVEGVEVVEESVEGVNEMDVIMSWNLYVVEEVSRAAV